MKKIHNVIIHFMGILYLVSTPIGNLNDITFRALETLFSVDIIAAEDTRKAGIFLQNLSKKYALKIKTETKPHILSYYDQIETEKIPYILNLLEQGRNVALVSDAGTPLISDPGYKLVQACYKRQIKVVPIPGPTSIITALVISGLAPIPFQFLGFFPDKSEKAQKLLNKLKQSSELLPATSIFFVAPHKLKPVLILLDSLIPDINISIVRELTKIYENVWSGKPSEALSKIDDFKGEIVLLIQPLKP